VPTLRQLPRKHPTLPPALRFSLVLMTAFVCGVFAFMWIGRARSQPVLAYVSNESGESEIYLLDSAAALRLPVRYGVKGGLQPTWGAAHELMFVLYRPQPLHVAALNLHNRRWQTWSIGNTRHETEPSWSSDGRVAVMTGNFQSDILIYDSNDHAEFAPFNTDSSFENEPTWCNEHQLAFASNRTGDFDIFLYDFNDDSLANLTDFIVDEYNPSCNSDGRIAFTATREFNAEIYVMDIATRAVQNISHHPASDIQPAWLADGRLSFVSERDGNREIYLYDFATRTLTNITHSPASDDQPAWRRCC
jgi:Tol biopolymer transport system component